MPAADSVPGLRWLGHATVLLEGPPVVYVDPWRLQAHEDLPPARLVLVTHAHFDHASPEDIQWIAGEDMVVAGPAPALRGLPGRHFVLEAGADVELEGVRVRAFASGDGDDGFHPPGEGLGYLVQGAGPSLLHVGDTTQAPPAFESPPDVIALPVCGGTVFTAEAAAEAAAASGARAALPIHWGDLQGGIDDARRFRDAMRASSPQVALILRRLTPPRG